MPPKHQTKRLTLFEGFAALPNLRELDVSHNGAENMLGLESNTELRVLRISYNRIRRVEGLHQLNRLEEVWCYPGENIPSPLLRKRSILYYDYTAVFILRSST